MGLESCLRSSSLGNRFRERSERSEFSGEGSWERPGGREGYRRRWTALYLQRDPQLNPLALELNYMGVSLQAFVCHFVQLLRLPPGKGVASGRGDPLG